MYVHRICDHGTKKLVVTDLRPTQNAITIYTPMNDCFCERSWQFHLGAFLQTHPITQSHGETNSSGAFQIDTSQVLRLQIWGVSDASY